MKIRNATAADAAEIERMIRDLVAYEGNTGTLAFGVEQLAAALSGSAPRLRALVAEDDGGLIGFVSYTIDFAIWTGGDVIRIDDVFVRARARGSGAGTRLMLRIAELALAGGMTCRWEMEASNLGAQYFYGTLGVDIREKVIARWSEAAMRAALARMQDRGS
ncbi:MAG: GNAT family N-acetyltransferase [Dongiaceae bacterium]